MLDFLEKYLEKALHGIYQQPDDVPFAGLKKNGKLTGKPVGTPHFFRPISRLPTPIPVFPFLPLFDVLSITFPVNNPVTKHVTSRVAMKP